MSNAKMKCKIWGLGILLQFQIYIKFGKKARYNVTNMPVKLKVQIFKISFVINYLRFGGLISFWRWKSHVCWYNFLRDVCWGRGQEKFAGFCVSIWSLGVLLVFLYVLYK